MKAKKIENIEDVVPVEESTGFVEEVNAEEQQEELTPEQKEQQEAFFRAMICGKFKYIFQTIYNRMKANHLTLDDLIQEINEKKSPLTRSQRDFVTGFKADFIMQCLNDMYKGPKAL